MSDAKTMEPPSPAIAAKEAAGTAFGCPRDFLDNRFVYTVVSARARGLSVGVNMNPDKHCNFDCAYCEVNRVEPGRETRLDVAIMSKELEHTLALVRSGEIRARPNYRNLPDQLLKLRHVALSGDGEPTLCPNFVEAAETVIHVRARGWFPFFKMVLITNASALDLPAVEEGLRLSREFLIDARSLVFVICQPRAGRVAESIVGSWLFMVRMTGPCSTACWLGSFCLDEYCPSLP
jgi:hypothetical protein